MLINNLCHTSQYFVKICYMFLLSDESLSPENIIITAANDKCQKMAQNMLIKSEPKIRLGGINEQTIISDETYNDWDTHAGPDYGGSG